MGIRKAMPIRPPKDCSRSQERPRRSCAGLQTEILFLSQLRKTKLNIPKTRNFSTNRKTTTPQRNICRRRFPGRKIRSRTPGYPTFCPTLKNLPKPPTACPKRNPDPNSPKSALRNSFQLFHQPQRALPQWTPATNPQPARNP